MSDLLNLADRVGWQPIETAPRDETVLVAGGDATYPVTACWGGEFGECWWVDGQEDVHVEIGWPTHWMPLPSPPAASLRAIHARGCADGEEGK